MNKQGVSILIGICSFILGATSYAGYQYYRVNNRVIPVVSTPPPSTPPATDTNVTVSTNHQIGYIKSVTQTGSQYQLVIDYIEFLSGEEARQAAKADGKCEDETCEIPNDYYIRNQNTKLRTFVIRSQPTITMETYSHGSDGNFNYNQSISLDTFVSIFQPGSRIPQRESPYWIDLDANNQIIAIKEQYLP